MSALEEWRALMLSSGYDMDQETQTERALRERAELERRAWQEIEEKRHAHNILFARAEKEFGRQEAERREAQRIAESEWRLMAEFERRLAREPDIRSASWRRLHETGFHIEGTSHYRTDKKLKRRKVRV